MADDLAPLRDWLRAWQTCVRAVDFAAGRRLCAPDIVASESAIRIDELAREAEARNFESLWVPEHTHIPTSRRSPFAGGQQLPEQYKHTLDPFVALTAAAAATKTLRVGTGICLIIERDTITTAKSVASLDLLSHGRFEFGLGGGWNAEEMEHQIGRAH